MTGRLVEGATTVDAEHTRHLLRQMLRVRRLEEKCVELYSAAKIRGFLHVYIGEEAVAAGVLETLTEGVVRVLNSPVGGPASAG